MYTLKSYDLQNKTYTEESSEFAFDMGFYRMDRSREQDLLISLIQGTEKYLSNINMETISNEEVKFTFMYTDTEAGTNMRGEEYYATNKYYSLTFKNDKLVEEMYTVIYKTDIGDSIEEGIVKYTYNIGDFTVDTSYCTLVESPESEG